MRPNDTDLSKQFAKFAGREVKAIEKTQNVKIGDTVYPITEVHLASDCPAVAELTAAVKAAGLQLRLWTPGSMGTMDYRLDRLNAGVEKAADGKFRISSSFTLG